MNVNRFFKLRQNFHVVDNNAPRNSNDRCWKVRPLLNAIRERCRELPLELSLCVDEQIIPFKGTISIKQYMKDKPESWGIKVYCLCGSSGILYGFIVYQGVTTEYREEYKAFGISAGTVMQLSERITEPNHQLYFDNFFSTYALFQWLKNRQIYAVGTIRINRFGNPPLLSDKDMKKKPRGFSQEVLSDNGNLIITKWYDNKPVTLGSNYVSIGTQYICRRWDKKNKLYINVKRPEIIQKYNKNMGSVDKLDFLLKIYRTFIKSKKWTLRIMTHCIDMALANSWLEYKKDCEILQVKKTKILDLLHFRQHVGEALILSNKTSSSQKKRGRPSKQAQNQLQPKRLYRPESVPVEEMRWDKIDHFPVFDEKPNTSRCKYLFCKQKSSVLCSKCNVHLCFMRGRNCYIDFHSKI